MISGLTRTVGANGNLSFTFTPKINAANLLNPAQFRNSHYTITVSGNLLDGSGNPVAGLLPVTTLPFDVVPDTAGAKFVFTQQPPTIVTAAAATNFGTVATLEDEFGNPIGNGLDTATLTMSSTPAGVGSSAFTAPAVVTATNASGLYAFPNLFVAVAGNYTLTVSDGGALAPNQNSKQFTVIAAAESQLVSLATIPNNQVAGQALTVAPQFAVEDAFGNVVASSTDTVSLALSGGNAAAILSGTLTTQVTAGIASFPGVSVNLGSLANYVVTATPSGAFAAAPTNGFTVIPAAASQLVITSQWASTIPRPEFTAGTNLTTSLVVQVQDALGNPVMNPTGTTVLTIGLASNPTGSGMQGGLTQKINANTPLVFTFNPSVTLANLTAAGQLSPNHYTISVAGTLQDGSGNPIAGFAPIVSLPFDIIPNLSGTTKYVFTQQPPTIVTASGTGNFGTVVTLEDQFGNPINNGTDTATLTMTPTPAVVGSSSFSGPTVSTLNANGVYNFPGLFVGVAGNYTLTVSGSLAASQNSNQFSVTSKASTSQLVFVGPTVSTQTGGAAFTVAPQFAFEDTFGNVVTTATDSVTISIDPAGAFIAGVLSGTVTAGPQGGIVTFPGLTIDKAGGLYDLLATDNVVGSNTATTNGFNVVAGPAFALTFTTQPPTTVVAGIAPGNLPVQVQVVDRGGNPVPTTPAGAPVFLTLAGGIVGPGVPVAGAPARNPYLIQTTAVSTDGTGLADFSSTPPDLQITGTNFTILAASQGLQSATSDGFSVTPDLSEPQLVFTQQPPALPTTVTAGNPVTITLEVTDEYGNQIQTSDQDFSGDTINLFDNLGALLATTTIPGASNNITVIGGVTENTVGVYSLNASDTTNSFTTDPNTGNSGNFTVVPGAVSNLVITAPVSVTSGQPFPSTVFVTVVDGTTSHNVVTSAAGTITLSNTHIAPTGSLSGTLTANVVNGVATFPGLVLTSAAPPATATLHAVGLATVSPTDATVTVTAGNMLTVMSNGGAIPGTTAGAFLGGANGVTVQVTDSLGNAVNVPNVLVAMSIDPATNPTGAPLFGNVIGTTDATGQVTFTDLAIDKSGTYDLLATAGGYAVASSSPFNVTAQTTGLFLSFTAATSQQPPQLPNTVTSAANFTVKVTLVDKFGNTDLTHDGAAIGAAVLHDSPHHVFTPTTPLTLGVATFTLSATETGVFFVEAFPLGPIPATKMASESFTVVDSGANKLVFVAPTFPITVTAGQSFPAAVQVKVQDAQGNTVTGSKNPITLGFSGAGTLSGTITTTPVDGIATFENLSIALGAASPGMAYDLQASSSGLTSTVTGTGNVNVLTGAANHLLITTTAGSPQTAGAPFDVTVTEVDASGTTVTGSSANVTLSLVLKPTGGSFSTAGANPLGESAGVAMFTAANADAVTITKAGTYVFMAQSATVGVLPVLSSPIVVGADAVTSPSLQVTTVLNNMATTTLVAGTAYVASVTLVDQFGNPITTGGDISDLYNLTLQPALGGAPSSTIATGLSLSSGANSSGINITLAGTYSILANDTTNGAVLGVSLPFTVIPDVTTKKLAFLQGAVIPTDTVNTPFPGVIQVAVEDGNNNVITTAQDAVTLTLQVGNGSLQGNLTVNAAGGVATFVGLFVNQTGSNDVLRASLGGLGGSPHADSGFFNVVAGSGSGSSAGTLTFTVFSPTTVSGGAAPLANATFAITVHAQNSSGAATGIPVQLLMGNNPTNTSLVSKAGTFTTQATTNGSGDADFIVSGNQITINQAGSNYTIVAIAAGDFSAAVSTPFDVVARPATHLVFTQQPALVTGTSVGALGAQAMPITVAAEDAFGNVDGSNVSAISLTFIDTVGATFTDASSPVTLVGGTGSFTVFIKTAVKDVCTLQATGGGLTAGVTSVFQTKP
jgi:hypothetical protein